MTPQDLLLSPVGFFILAIAMGYLLYTWSRTVAPAFRPLAGKTMPYVGGEVMEAQAYRPGYQFYYVALFFVVVHVAALVISTAPPDAPLWGTLGFLALVAVAVMVMRWEQ
jgi:NADH:ubiquinone oxidoreductase subunit 3 (subunit A)